MRSCRRSRVFINVSQPTQDRRCKKRNKCLLCSYSCTNISKPRHRIKFSNIYIHNRICWTLRRPQIKCIYCIMCVCMEYLKMTWPFLAYGQENIPFFVLLNKKHSVCESKLNASTEKIHMRIIRRGTKKRQLATPCHEILFCIQFCFFLIIRCFSIKNQQQKNSINKWMCCNLNI